MGEHRVSAWLDVLWRGRLRVPLANLFLPSAGIQAGREEGAPSAVCAGGRWGEDAAVVQLGQGRHELDMAGLSVTAVGMGGAVPEKPSRPRLEMDSMEVGQRHSFAI